MSGYLEIPAGWERVSSGGPWPFVTSELLRRPDGSVVRWHSRAHRKGSGARRVVGAAEASAGAAAPRAHERGGGGVESVWWRPRTRAWWMAVLFAAGSLCFALAAVASEWASGTRPAIDVTFFVGSLLFTAAAYLQYWEAVNVEHQLSPGARRHWRPVSWEPRRIDWLASLVQLIGTLFFNISTFAAMKHGLDTRQANARVWAPDVFGSICFLLSSELAFAEVCQRWVGIDWGSLSWRIVALNLLGSLAFGVAAIASLTEPSTGEPVSARIANGGTALGGLCFLLGALALMPEAARSQEPSTRGAEPAAAAAA